MQETAYIIKQDGMPLGHTIRWRILSAGFDVVANKYLKGGLPMRAFESIYPFNEHSDKPMEMRQFMAVFNTTGECEIGILRGENVVRRFLTLAGKHSNPALCSIGTIRREYGAVRAHVICGHPIHLKVLHRSENAKEAARDVEVIRSLIGA